MLGPMPAPAPAMEFAVRADGETDDGVPDRNDAGAGCSEPVARGAWLKRISLPVN